MQLNKGNLKVAENKFKECLGFLKHTNSTETVGYNLILRKLIQTLIKGRRFEESEKLLLASLTLSEKLTSNPELLFNSHRNLLAFYTYTDISKAIDYCESLLKNDGISENAKKFFIYAAGPINLLNNNYRKARSFIDQSISSSLPSKFIGFSLHNLAVLNSEKQRHSTLVPEEVKAKWIIENDYQENPDLDKDFLLYNKQALAMMEIKGRETEDINSLNEFLSSAHPVPHNVSDIAMDTEILSKFTSGVSALTISNLAEFFFEKDQKTETAFWIKLGLKYLDKHEPDALPRHLLLTALFYSQLGQTMMAEGLYRKGLQLLENQLDYNVVFGMNMYGRLLLRQNKREKEANELLEKSEKIASVLPFWYNRMVKVRILDYDFD